MGKFQNRISPGNVGAEPGCATGADAVSPSPAAEGLVHFDEGTTLPPTLYKAYGLPKHAAAFLQQGQMLLRKIEAFRRIEDPNRQDQTEGHAIWRERTDEMITVHLDTVTHEVLGESKGPGILNCESTFQNPTYLFCTSGPSVDLALLTNKFGQHVIEIFDVPTFVTRCRRAFSRWPTLGREVAFLLLLPVTYTKGEILERCIGSRMDRDFAQKPRRFEQEVEWRLVAVLEGGGRDSLPNEVTIELGAAGAFARTAFRPRRL